MLGTVSATVFAGGNMRRQNVTGRRVAYLRSRRNWTQEILVARLQCAGFDISRQTLAKIELGLRKVSDEWLTGFQKVFGLPLIQFFPQEVQDLDEELAQRVTRHLPDSDATRKSRHPCQKLTKRGPPP
jgi:transcriptional regulator with XRE-family HTH domain